jgi:diguanylate cyclase (GGDEF)-like protein
MKSYSLPTKLYLFTVYLAGMAILFSHIHGLHFENQWLLVALCLLASLALVLRVEGSAIRDHYSFSFVIYGFSFVAYGASDTLLVILISHIVEWIWYRPPLSFQFFSIAVYFVAIQVGGLVFSWISHNSSLVSARDIHAIILGMAVFTLSSHIMTGLLHWLILRENFKKSDMFDPFPLILDLSLLYFGASLSIVWKYNPFAIILFIVPTYMLYRALRIPALERKTELDSKTGLFNHAYFKKQLDGELARSNRFDRPLSVIIADLDLLRNINNTYGHLAGDEVLIGVARALKQSVREYDVVSRFGGEEFAILLPEATLLQAYEKAEFFRKTIEGMEFVVPTSSSPIRVTMSFGVAHRENFNQTSSDIVHNADLALYNSKLQGRNRTYAHTNNACIDFPVSRAEKDVDQPALI